MKHWRGIAAVCAMWAGIGLLLWQPLIVRFVILAGIVIFSSLFIYLVAAEAGFSDDQSSDCAFGSETESHK